MLRTGRYNVRQFLHTHLLFAVLDLLAVLLALLCAYYIRFHSGWISIIEHQDFFFYFRSFLVVAPLHVLLFFWLGNYQERFGNLSYYEIRNVIRSLITFYLLCIAITFLAYRHEYSRMTIGLSFLFNVVFALIFRKFLVSRQVRRWKRGIGRASVWIVTGNRELGEKIKDFIRTSPGCGYSVLGIVDVEEASSILSSEPVDRLMLAGDFSYSQIADFVLLLPSSAKIDFVPGYYPFLRAASFERQLGMFPLIPLNQHLMPDWYSFNKRIMDVLISSVLLLLISPVLLMIVVSVYLSYGGPVLYRQSRVGKNGRLFTLYKFRTMEVDSEGETASVVASEKRAVFKWKNDPRVPNRFAWFLRRTGLDEIPQLWNVLLGQMSLVGPRPATPDLVSNYEPEQKLRLFLQPGITGLQQVSCRGSDSIGEVLKYDLDYVQNRNLWLDLKILTRTFLTVISGKGVS